MARKLRQEIPPIADLPEVATDDVQWLPPGHDMRALGPSDSSDSGSDLTGVGGLDSTTDRQRTGERASADLEDEEELRTDADIEPDRVVEARQAGLGGGLDQAEEAQLGITDEEIDALDADAE